MKRGRPKLELPMDQILRLRKEGLGLTKIAKKCGVAKSTLWRALNVFLEPCQKSHSAISPRAGPVPLGSRGNGHQRAARGKNVVSYLLHPRTLGRALRIVHVEFHPEDEPYAKVLRQDVWYDVGFKKVRTEAGEA